jgi:hypothetical protein
MAENAALDQFLAAPGETMPQTPQEPPQPAEPTPAPPTPTPAPTPSTPTPEPPAKEADEDEGLAQHVQGGDNRSVPFSALEKVRNDWKSKHAAEKAKADLLAQQLEAFQKQQAAPPPPSQPQVQYLPPPDPAIDPVGAFRYLQAEQQRTDLNRTLNISEALLRKEIGAQKVNEYVADFKAHADKDPSLWGKLYSQPMPYEWLAKEIDRLRAHAEIGDDPAAYRARVVAEERAKWESEQQTQQPGNGAQRPSPVAGMAPSLAGVRSMAGRTQPSFSGPPSMDDILRRPDRRASR